MNFLMIGDVVGRVGRNALHSNLTEIKKKFEIDFTIVNAENSAAGFGLTPKIYEELIAMGVDAVTLGNHAWDKIEIIDYMESNPNHSIIRPLNFLNDSPGRGYKIFDHPNGKKILVCQVHTKLFINLPLNMFKSITIKSALAHPNWRMGKKISIDSRPSYLCGGYWRRRFMGSRVIGEAWYRQNNAN